MKILVVDDERLLVKGIKFNLENEGYTVDAGYDGEDAVNMARTGEYDLIILDLMMPKKDGLQACQEIRSFSTVPIIMLTARSEGADLAAVLFTLLGVALFFFDQLKPGYILGNCVAIVAGMFMAGMFVTVGEMQGEERFSAIFIGQMLTFLVGLPFVIATKPELTAQTLGCILALGVFQLGISYILYVKASVYCTPLACCLLGAVEPLLNPVWVFLFDGERPGLFALIGSVIVIVSVTLWCIFGKEKAAAGEEHA